MVNYILDKDAIQLKIRRMALEIAERNNAEKALVLAGIEPNGRYILGDLIPVLQAHFSGSIEVQYISLDKVQPQEVKVAPVLDLAGKVLVIVDDVSNSGKTLTYALKPYLNSYPSKIQTLVLVNRSHKKYAIQPDYVGHALATTIQEYIDVDIVEGHLVAAWAR